MKTTKVVLLTTTDVHGHITPQGMANAASVIEQTRQTEPNVIFLDNGDLIQGTPLSHYAITESEAPNPIIQIYNQLKCDAAVIGNHEFNYGKIALDNVVKQSTFPWLSANVVYKGTTTPYFGQPYITKKFQGFKISILGLTTKHVPYWESRTNIAAFDFLDPLETGKYWFNYLKQTEKSDIIIVSYHGGFEQDPETLQSIAPSNGENQGNLLLAALPDIDVLITGHQHLLYAMTSTTGQIVLQAGTQAAYVGRIDLCLQQHTDGRVTKNHTVQLLPTQNYPAHPKILNTMQKIESEVDSWLDERLGRLSFPIVIQDPLHDVWLKEHPLIEWINRTLMTTADVNIACTPLLNIGKFSLSSFITRRDIYRLYPFPNTLTVVALTGDDIREALEVSASFLMKDNQGQISIHPDWKSPRLLSYNYDMWEGIEYTIDLNEPIGKRLVRVSYNGAPLCNQIYHVATSSYRASGSGGYHMFNPNKIVQETKLDIVTLLTSTLLNEKTIQAKVNHNWSIVY